MCFPDPSGSKFPAETLFLPRALAWRAPPSLSSGLLQTHAPLRRPLCFWSTFSIFENMLENLFYRDFSTGRVRRKLNLTEGIGASSACSASSSSPQQVGSRCCHLFWTWLKRSCVLSAYVPLFVWALFEGLSGFRFCSYASTSLYFAFFCLSVLLHFFVEVRGQGCISW